MKTTTLRFHRVLAAPPAKVFRAFTEPDAMERWFPPNGFTATVHHMEARKGGTFRMSFTNFTTGTSHTFGGVFRELVPDEKVVYSEKFESGLPMDWELQTTVTLKAVSCGTELNITQEGDFGDMPTEYCVMGWQQSLNHLATLVEPDIPD